MAISVLAMAFVIIVNLLPSSRYAARKGGAALAADQVAQSILEEWRAKPFEDLIIGPPQSLPPATIEGATILYPTIEVADQGADRLRRLIVRIDYNHAGRDYHVEHELMVVDVKR